MSTKWGKDQYDNVGRLEKVWRNDTLTVEYQYDANGNRLAKITPTDTMRGVYDEQDRLLKYSTSKYLYTSNGDLTMKVDTVTSDTTRYSYDALGALRNVTLSDGTLIEYLIDASGKRVGRKANGVITQKWLYSSDLRIIAEVDSANNITSRFVYTTSENVPEYFEKSDTVYRIITDHLGSVQQIVNTQTGTVIQQIDYDEYGNVLADSNPEFAPFSFAGGLYDSQTKLVRFGVRDYDPEAGRWTCKDPILFNGKSPNLYRYVNCDPVNSNDPNGKVNYNKMDLAALEYTKGCMTMLLGYLEIILDYELYMASYPLSSFGYGIPGMTIGIIGMTYGYYHMMEGLREVIYSIADFSEAMIE